MTAGSREWHDAKDILKAWKKMTATVDIVNQRIFNNEKSPDQCACPPTQKGTGDHVCLCGGCGRSTVCSGLEDHILGYRACGPCCQETLTETGTLTETPAWASEIAETSFYLTTILSLDEWIFDSDEAAMGRLWLGIRLKVSLRWWMDDRSSYTFPSPTIILPFINFPTRRSW